MRANEFTASLDELIKPDIVNQKPFKLEHYDERGLHWTAQSNGDFSLYITVDDTHGRQIAYVTLEVNPDEDTMSSADTWVDQRYRRTGIATKMYNWGKELGGDVIRSNTLSAQGKKFWKSRDQS
jgi:GNAT superfamily N-acetyltransferase